MSATFHLDIPSDTLASARMTVDEARLELAIALFARQRLSFGKAAELAGISVGEFQMHLGSRQLGPHLLAHDILEDVATLRGLQKE